GHDAPESSVDDDGHADRGPRAYGPRSVCDRTMRGPGVVDARRDPCLADPRDRAAVTLDGPAPPDGAEVAVGSCKHGRAAIVVVAEQHAEGGVEHACHLVPDAFEHTVRSRPLGDER